MHQETISPDIQAIHRFVDRYRDDHGFHDLAHRDARAALAAVGIRVPGGVRVSLASDAASALDMMLDQGAVGGASSTELDDSQLLDVVGGVKFNGYSEEIRGFLDLFKLNRA